VSGETVADITAEMRRAMPNSCGDWADWIDAAVRPQPTSLRDWFAGQALGPLVAKGMPTSFGSDLEQWQKTIASASYGIAAAMLATREQVA
jgi:hypothetical protein